MEDQQIARIIVVRVVWQWYTVVRRKLLLHSAGQNSVSSVHTHVPRHHVISNSHFGGAKTLIWRASRYTGDCLSQRESYTCIVYQNVNVFLSYPLGIHSFSILSNDRSKASSKTIPPHSAIQSFLLQMRVSSPVLKVIQQLPTSSSSSSCHFHLSLYLSFDDLFQKAVST